MSEVLSLIEDMNRFYRDFPYEYQVSGLPEYIRVSDWAKKNLGEGANRRREETGAWTNFGMSIRFKNKEDFLKMRLSVE